MPADTYADDGSGVQLQDKLLDDALGTDQDPDYLDTSGGTAGAGSYGHDDNGGHPE